MIIFLYGSDSYLLKKGRLDIIKEYKKKYQSGINLFHCSFSELNDMDALESLLKNSSFFNEHRLAVVSNVFTKKIISDKIAALLKNYDLPIIKDTTFLFAETGTKKDLESKNKDLFKILTDPKSVTRIFEPLEGGGLLNWVRNEFKVRNCSIKLPVLEELVSMIGNDSWALMNEIEKLAAFKKEGEIDQKDIIQLTSLSRGSNIFNLIDAIASNNKLRSSELLYRELASGHDSYYLFTIITNQFRNFIMIKSLAESGFSQTTIAQKTALHPYVVKKTFPHLSRLNMDNLKSKYEVLLKIDIESKSGKSNLTDSLFRFLLT